MSRPTDAAERAAEQRSDDLERAGGTAPRVSPEPAAAGARRGSWTRSDDPGTPMPGALRTRAEHVFGTEFSGVRIHDDARARAWAGRLHASAFTVGADIYFGADQFRPHTPAGRRLIAHELTHVVQQSQAPGAPQIQRMVAPAGDELAAETREFGLERKRHQLYTLLDGGAAGQALDLLKTFDQDEFSTLVHGLTNAEANAVLGAAAAQGDKEVERRIRDVRGLTQSDSPPMTPLGAEVFESRHGDSLDDVRSLIQAGKFRVALQVLAGLSAQSFDAVVDALTTEEVSLLLRRGRLLSTRKVRDKIRATRSREVVVNTVLLSNATDTITADFARANQLFNPIGVEIERGAHARLSPSQLQGTGRLDADNDEHTERFIANFPDRGRITAFWVNGLVQSWRGYQKVVAGSAGGVVVETVSRMQDTFAHEVGHALGLPHLTENATDPGADPNNLMASGTYRVTTGAPGTDLLDAHQRKEILRNALLEPGRRGVSR